MPRKWLLVGLAVLLVALLAAAGAGWRRLGQFEPPFLLEVAPYRLSQNWYIGEFQPLYLGKATIDGNPGLKVAFRDRSGRLKVGDVMVGGQGAGENISSLALPANLRWGQRLRVQYLLYTKTPEANELTRYCEASARLCQVANVVTATQAPEPVQTASGKEPQFPVWATEISGRLNN